MNGNKFKPSYSRVNSILDCPKKYNEVGFDTNFELYRGTMFHESFEHYLKTGKKNPIYAPSDDFIDKVDQTLGLTEKHVVQSEYELNTIDFKGFIDLVVIDEELKQLFIFDLKIINDKNEEKYSLSHFGEQMNLYMARYLEMNPKYKDYDLYIGYILYLKKSSKLKYDVIECVDYRDVKDNFDKKVKAAKHIVESDNYYAKKNEYCGFCPLNKTCKGR